MFSWIELLFPCVSMRSMGEHVQDRDVKWTVRTWELTSIRSDRFARSKWD